MLARRFSRAIVLQLTIALLGCGGAETAHNREPCPVGGCECVNQTCLLNCTDLDTCDLECTDGADCDLECRAADSCNAECIEQGDCYVDCGTATTCTVHCALGSQCSCDGDACSLVCDEEQVTCDGGPCSCG